jgi:hypothetical protein
LAGLDNVYLHFLRSGGDVPPQTFGVHAFWDHLWTKTAPASVAARKDALQRRLATNLDSGLKLVATSTVAFDNIELKRPARGDFRAGAEAIGASEMKTAVLDTFDEPASGGGLHNLIGKGAAKGIFAGRFKYQFESFVGVYDKTIDDLDMRIRAAVRSILSLIGVPPDRTFEQLSDDRSIIKDEQSAKRLQAWRAEYQASFPARDVHATPDDVKEAIGLLGALASDNAKSREPDATSPGLTLLNKLLNDYEEAEKQRAAAARPGAMFHALRGALSDTCEWRNSPLAEKDSRPRNWIDKYSAAEDWIQENPALTMAEALTNNFARSNASGASDEGERDWFERIRPAIQLLAGYAVALPTLHVRLLETDQVKIRSVESSQTIYNPIEKALVALDTLRRLAIAVRAGRPLNQRLRAIATLAVISPLLRSLNVDPGKMFAEEEKEGDTVNDFVQAQDALQDMELQWRGRGFFSFLRPDPKVLANINDKLKIARNALANYATAGGEPVGSKAGASKKATRQAKRGVDFALWVARNVAEAPFVAELRKPGTEPADVFGREIEAVLAPMRACNDALNAFYAELKNALLQERYQYVVESGLLNGEQTIAANLGTIFHTLAPSKGPTTKADSNNELVINAKEAGLQQATATLLSRLSVP